MKFAVQVITAVVLIVEWFSTLQSVRPYTISFDNEYVIDNKDNINVNDFFLFF